jgi:hypothetical protein
VIALLAALALAVDPSVKPWPIGPTAAFRPSAGGDPFTAACPAAGTFRVHVELYADKNVVIVPAGIGACADPVRTRTPTGVVEVAVGTPHTVGELFRAWGQPLGAHRLASFRSTSAVRAYLNGRRTAGPPAAIPLRPGAEIVLEIGGYVPPHRLFLFPKGR